MSDNGNFMDGPPRGTCQVCKTRPAAHWFSNEGTVGLVHGYYEARCERCVVEEQLTHAREVAARLPALEAKWAALEKT